MQKSVKQLLLSAIVLSAFASSGAFAQHGGGGHGGGGGGGSHGGGGGHSSGGGSHGGGNSGGNHGGGNNHGGNNHGGGSHSGGNHNGNNGGGKVKPPPASSLPRGYSNVGHGQLKGQKVVKINNQKYVQRTFVNGRNVRVRVTYAPRFWGGRPYYAYYHTWGFQPWFWGAYWGPWSPWAWSWGWYGAPWYATYWGWYFHPYPTYVGPSFWITDWVIADMLQASYDRGVAEGAAQSSTPTSAPISDDVKTQIASQVDQTTKDYQANTPVDIKDALANPNYIFAVNETLSLSIVNSTATCKLTEGDLVKVVNAPTDANPVATVSVISSKFGSCAAGSQVSVSVQNLQEMLNSFAERVDNGLHELEKNKAPQGASVPAQALP